MLACHAGTCAFQNDSVVVQTEIALGVTKRTNKKNVLLVGNSSSWEARRNMGNRKAKCMRVCVCSFKDLNLEEA